MIAQSRLSPATLQAIGGILGQDAKNVDLSLIANCADSFAYGGQRSCAGLFDVQGDTAATRLWHYIDIPVSGGDAAFMMKYCPGGVNCVVAQIRKDMAVLSDPAAAPIDKKMALMFLVHFVGDEHQPLHCADDNDKGGNKKVMSAIVYSGKAINLHSLWDDEIDSPEQVDWHLPEAVLAAKAKKIAARIEKKLRSGSENTASWTKGDMAGSAAAESFSIAKNVVYKVYKKTSGKGALADYQAAWRGQAYQRIEMAGVRLAALLEQALGPAARRN